MVLQLYKFSQVWPGGTQQHAALSRGNSRGNFTISVSQNELAESHSMATAKLGTMVGFFSAPSCPRLCKLRCPEPEMKTGLYCCKVVLKLKILRMAAAGRSLAQV